MPARRLCPDDISTFLDALSSAQRIAVDTEFHAERRYIPRLYLVQVYVPGGDAWIIDPLEDGLLDAVATGLKAVSWIVHGGSQDIRLLSRALGGLPDEVLDTQIGAGLAAERYPEGYGSLVQRYLGRTLPKTATLSDWSQRPLTADQIRYAADDVLRLPDLWAAIERSLDALGRVSLARAACAEFVERWRHEPDPHLAWRRFGAATGMSASARSVLRELASWREEVAQRKNQPTRSILGDGSLIELSKRPPSSRDGILANRRFPRSAQKHVDAIWDAIGRGRDCPPGETPSLPERYSGPWRTAHALQAWAVQTGHDCRWSPRLVLDDDRQGDLVLHPPVQRQDLAQRLGPWRDALLGDALWDWISGNAHLSVAQGASTVVRHHAPQKS